MAKPFGETRPGWKVLRVLGTMLGLPGFEAETVEQVRAAALGDLAAIEARLDNGIDIPASLTAIIEGKPPAIVERIADWPIYATDAIVRRAPSLQATADAAAPRAGLPSALWRSLGLGANAWVQIKRGNAAVRLQAYHDPSLAPGAVRIPAGSAATAAIGASFGELAVEKLANAAGVPVAEAGSTR